jgi:hypothetical protein
VKICAIPWLKNFIFRAEILPISCGESSTPNPERFRDFRISGDETAGIQRQSLIADMPRPAGGELHIIFYSGPFFAVDKTDKTMFYARV